jgi:deazaflavin-dependent oxidoreductase (nitroreductase family)
MTANKRSRIPSFVRFINPIIKDMVRVGFPTGPIPMILLTVHGRKTGLPRTTPVGLFEVAGRRYLFSTFGEVNWVQNLRAKGEAIISRRRRKETLTADELSPEAAASILRDAFAPYLASFLMRPMLRSWYGVWRDTSLTDFVNVARSHPVFELRESHPA